jgi:hypothetical protein
MSRIRRREGASISTPVNGRHARGGRGASRETTSDDNDAIYAASWINVFGVASMASLAVVMGSGMILTVKDPAWSHGTGVGRSFNSVHLWAVEIFFCAAVVHLWGKFWMAAWRGRRSLVWVSGVVAFLAGAPAALTGYISQENFGAQWLSIRAKDAMNSVGFGAFFNLTDFGQMYTYHVLLLPVAVLALVIVHVLLVRRHGAVPPLDLASATAPSLGGEDAALPGKTTPGRSAKA